MPGRSERLVRGVIAGTFALVVAAFSHLVGGGAVPSALALATGSVFAIVLATFALGRRPSLPRLALAVAGAQLAFHALFSLLTPGTVASGASMAGAHEHLSALGAIAASAPHSASAGMWLAHGIAMVATVLFLRRVEVALWGLFAGAIARVRELSGLTAIAPEHARPAPAVGAAPVSPTTPLVGALSRRGPPVLAAH